MIHRIRLPAIGGLVTTLGGIAASPAFLNILDPKWAALVSAVGALIAAQTKPAIRKEGEPH